MWSDFLKGFLTFAKNVSRDGAGPSSPRQAANDRPQTFNGKKTRGFLWNYLTFSL